MGYKLRYTYGIPIGSNISSTLKPCQWITIKNGKLAIWVPEGV